ncbi:MAG: hypothetical protein WCV84_03405 [Patescibacteria group bacterium]
MDNEERSVTVLCRLVRAWLSDAGLPEAIGIVGSCSAHAAITTIAATKGSLPFFLITDGEMPVMSGTELIRRTHVQMGSFPSAKSYCTVMMSGNYDLFKDAHLVGARRFFQKPLPDEESAVLKKMIVDFFRDACVAR